MVEKYQEKILEASRKTFSVLIPVMDLTNHDPHVKMIWTQQYDDISLESQELLGQGQEVHNNYGPKGNEECRSDRLAFITQVTSTNTQQCSWALDFVSRRTPGT